MRRFTALAMAGLLAFVGEAGAWAQKPPTGEPSSREKACDVAPEPDRDISPATMIQMPALRPYVSSYRVFWDGYEVREADFGRVFTTRKRSVVTVQAFDERGEMLLPEYRRHWSRPSHDVDEVAKIILPHVERDFVRPLWFVPAVLSAVVSVASFVGGANPGAQERALPYAFGTVFGLTALITGSIAFIPQNYWQHPEPASR